MHVAVMLVSHAALLQLLRPVSRQVLLKRMALRNLNWLISQLVRKSLWSLKMQSHFIRHWRDQHIYARIAFFYNA